MAKKRSWGQALLSFIPTRKEVIGKDEIVNLLHFHPGLVFLERVEIDRNTIQGIFSPSTDAECRGVTADGNACMSRSDVEEMAVQLVMIVALRHGNFSVADPDTLADAREVYLGPQWRYEAPAVIGHRVTIVIDPCNLHRFTDSHQLKCDKVNVFVGNDEVALFTDVLVQVTGDRTVAPP